MSDRLKTLLALAAVTGLAAWSFAGVLAAPGMVGRTWDWGVPNYAEQFRAMADHHFSTWDAYFETGRYHYFKLELLYWLAVTPFSFLGGETVSKGLPLILVIASGIALWPLARFLGLNRFWSALAALYYALSPYTFSRVVAGHMPMLAGYALLPLVLWAYFALLRDIRARGRLAAWRVALCGLLVGLTSLHPSLGMSCVAMLGLLGLYFAVAGPSRWRVAWGTGCVFGLALLMNIHFMAPFLADYLGQGAIRHGWGLSASAKGEVTVDTELPMRESFHQSTSQPADAAVLLDLRPGMDTEYVYPAPPGWRGAWLAASLVLAGLALSAFTARRRVPEVGGLFTVALTGILLVCGSRTPFGLAFYQGALKHILPILFAAFSNTTRWLPLIVTAYALLAFQLPQAWEERAGRARWPLRLGLAAALLVFLSPYLGGQLKRPTAPDTTPQPLALKQTPLHPEDARVYAFLRDLRAEGRVAYLPPVGLSWPGDTPYSYEWTSAYSPKPFFMAFYNNPLANAAINTLFSPQPSTRLDRLLGLASVRYLVYPRYDFFISYKDFQPAFQGTPVVDGFKNYKPVLDRTLALQEGLVLEKRFVTVDLYRNPSAAPSVLAGGQVAAVADASGRGADLTAQVLPDVVGLPGYRPGQVLVAAGDDPGFLALLTRVLGPIEDRSLLLDRASGSRALLFTGAWRDPPDLEFRRISPTACRVRLRGVRQGFPLVFLETFHRGWKAYVTPLDGDWTPDAATLAAAYRVFPGNEADQADPAELTGYLGRGLVTTLGNGKEKVRTALEYGPGGRTVARREERFTVDFVGKRFLTSLQNDNLPGTSPWGAWSAGGFEPAGPGADFDPLAGNAWTAPGADRGIPLAWPELLHWQADSYANAWWIDPAVLDGLGAARERYARPSPAGGLDMELLIEFRPQRFYLLGLAASALTVGVCLTFLAWTGLRGLCRREAARG